MNAQYAKEVICSRPIDTVKWALTLFGILVRGLPRWC